MDNRNAQVPWTEAQWNQVTDAISQEAQRTRVAARFLPTYGPLPASTQAVAAEMMDEAAVVIDDITTMPMVDLSFQFNLSGQQVQEEDLSSALLVFRRAANIVARAEDNVIFNGVPAAGVTGGFTGFPALTLTFGPPPPFAAPITLPPGLLNPWGPPLYGAPPDGHVIVVAKAGGVPTAVGLIAAEVAAVNACEGDGHSGPFASVLSNRLFQTALTPQPPNSGTLPKDRIEPLLGSELLRSATIPDPQGVVVSLTGNPVDLAVAADLTAQFLFINPQANYVFRVYERFVLRIKEALAISVLQ